MRAVIRLRLPSYKPPLDGARTHAWACVKGRKGARGRRQSLRIFMRGLPCETPSLLFSSPRTYLPFSLVWSSLLPRHRLFSRFFPVLSDLEKSNWFSYPNNSWLLESRSRVLLPTNENGWLLVQWAEYVHFAFFRGDMKRGLFITFTSQERNLNRLYNPHFSEFRGKITNA